MVLKYSKLFTMIEGLTREPVTILVEAIETIDGDNLIGIKTLQGEYGSARDFEESIDYTIGRWERGDISTRKEVKMWTLLTFMLPEANRLVDSLNEALQVYEEG